MLVAIFENEHFTCHMQSRLTTPEPHTSGIKMKSEVRGSSGAKFQFQYITWPGSLNFINFKSTINSATGCFAVENYEHRISGACMIQGQGFQRILPC